MAVDDFLVTKDLCTKHKVWRQNNVGYSDTLTNFCDSFAKYKKQPNRYKNYKTTGSIICCMKHTTHKTLAGIVAGSPSIVGVVNGQQKSLPLSGFCDITNYLKYIKSPAERLTCYFGLHVFLSFGGVVRIGSNDYTTFDDDAMLDEIYDQTKHIK